MAWYLRYRSNYQRLSALAWPFGLTLLPMLMILLEPDLGTVMIMMPMFLAMLFVAGARTKHLLIIVLAAAAVSPLLWSQMHNYQKMRISAVLLKNKLDGSDSWMMQKARTHPLLAKTLGVDKNTLNNWKLNHGYQLVRSKLAIASGQTTGQGYRKGPFLKYNFLPDRHNDFVFALIGHQFGFAGCAAVLALYMAVIACAIEIASQNTDPFGKLIAAGIAAMFAVQVIVNVSMTVGLMPITGLTLPFVSYGGSSLITTWLCIALVINVDMRRTIF